MSCSSSRKSWISGSIRVCCHNVPDKLASIYPCPADVSLPKYLRHEMLHIALAALYAPDEPYGVRRRLEEEFVQDICRLTHV